MSGSTSVRKLLQITSISLLTSIPLGSLAGSEWSTTSGTVSAVYSHNGFHFMQTSIPDAPCGAGGRFWWPISANQNAKDMFALALTAFVAGKRVSVAHDAAAPNCSNSGNLATHMVISD
jgi:hypothetical protein